MTAEQFIKAQLVELCWREAFHYGGVDNMLAIAFVVRNRVRAGWGDWLECVYQHDRWSAEYTHVKVVSQPDLRNLQVRLLMQQVDDIYNGIATDKYTDGQGLWYAELDRVESQHFLEQVCRNPAEHPRVATVGPVVFFK